MNGTGNDFVILDARAQPLHLTPEHIRQLAARSNPITKGCDQLIVMEAAPRQPSPATFMRIYNPDSSEVSACGNATRCVAWLLMEESGQDETTIATRAGILHAKRAGERRVTVNMGAPRFANAEIPLAAGINPEHLPEMEGMKDGAAVGMGNPHAVFFVADAQSIPLEHIGAAIERRTDIFPEKVNVSFAQVQSPTTILLRVWERGAGATLACGTAACATLVAAARRGLTKQAADIRLPGGTLHVDWDAESGHVWMTGEVELEFTGSL